MELITEPKPRPLVAKTEKQFIHTAEASKAQTMETWNTEGREAAQGRYTVQ